MHPVGKLTSRQRILRATQQELLESGILGLRMEVVAEKAEVSVPLIYKYYGSRDGLLTEVLSRLYDGDSYQKLSAYADVFVEMKMLDGCSKNSVIASGTDCKIIHIGI